jgi:hypothetical protein
MRCSKCRKEGGGGRCGRKAKAARSAEKSALTKTPPEGGGVLRSRANAAPIRSLG